MLASSGANSSFCALTIKGSLSLFSVKDIQSLESCVLRVQTSITELLKIANSVDQKVYVQELKISCDGGIFISLTDGARFQYDEATRLWRKIMASIA